tara:strand:- start:3282 stop:3836 length:555 start_codon:yes stop_codon:yes gene_type:complete
MRRRNQPDKSIITADAGMAYHVMYQGIDQPISKESIYYMVARETGLNAKAMHDERLVEEIKEQVARLEGEIEVKEEETPKQAYDPSLQVKDVEMDKSYQAELAQEQAVAEKELKEAEDKLKEKLANAGNADVSQEEQLVEKLAQKLEEKMEQKIAQKMGDGQEGHQAQPQDAQPPAEQQGGNNQ